MTSFTFTCLSFFCMVFSLHELASFVCPLVCGQKGGPPINALYVSYVRGQGILRFSVLFKFKFLHALARHHVTPSRHQIARTPSRHARVTPSRHQHCTHTITACSCDTFTASSLHTRTPSRHAHETHETPSRHLVLMMRHRRGIFRSRPAKGVGCLRKSETQ